MRTDAYAAILRMCNTTASNPAVENVWVLFRVDARSDPTLDGMGMAQLRLLYRNGEGGVPMNSELRSHRVFLVADEEVLLSGDADAAVIKCVQADYVAADYVPGNTWVGGQSYFGWMRVKG